MRLHEGKLREASRRFSFFLENSSIAPSLKHTGGVKRVMLLVVRLEVVAPLFAHVSGVLLTLFVNGERALPAQYKKKLQ